MQPGVPRLASPIPDMAPFRVSIRRANLNSSLLVIVLIL